MFESTPLKHRFPPSFIPKAGHNDVEQKFPKFRTKFSMFISYVDSFQSNLTANMKTILDAAELKDDLELEKLKESVEIEQKLLDDAFM